MLAFAGVREIVENTDNLTMDYMQDISSWKRNRLLLDFVTLTPLDFDKVTLGGIIFDGCFFTEKVHHANSRRYTDQPFNTVSLVA